MPKRGEARPEQLADGTPVFLVHHRDGRVTVLSAVSAHHPLGLQQLVGWCRPSQGPEDPLLGSQFDEFGRTRGGPAPQAWP